MIDELEIAERWNNSLAVNPEQAWTEISALVPETITRDELRKILRHHWKLVQTVEVRLERHQEDMWAKQSNDVTPKA